MFVALAAASFVLVREAAWLPATPQRTLLLVAACLVSLTGIYPERFGRAHTRDAGSDVLYGGAFSLHVLGLLSATIGFVQMPFWRVVLHARRLHTKSRGVGLCLSADWARLLAIRAVHAGCILVYLVLFFSHRTLPDISDYCAPLRHDPAACNAWPNLTVSACERVARLRTGPAWRGIPTGVVLPTHYSCAFVDNGVSEEDELLLPASSVPGRAAECLRARCTLFENALSIAFEFGALLLICTYTGCYALGDVRWVLEQERDEAGSGATESGMLGAPDEALLALAHVGYVQRAAAAADHSSSFVNGDAVETPPRTSGMV